MKNERKENIIIVVVAVILIMGYVIFMSYQVNYWKHQNIAYEQYKAEDLRQARIYNYTFAESEEDFENKIKDIPETDQEIAKYVYQARPEVDIIKQEYKEQGKIKSTAEEKVNTLTSSKNNAINELENRTHNILDDNRAKLTLEGINTIEDYVIKYNIKGNISISEYDHLYDMFVTNGDSYEIAEFTNVVKEYNIQPDETVPTQQELEDNLQKVTQELQEAEQELSVEEQKLNDIKAKLDPIRNEGNDIIKENSVPLEYQETITTNGIKSAIDYLTTI